MATKQSVPVPLAASIAGVALAAIGYFGYRTLSGPSYPKIPNSVELHSKAEQLALQAAGDYSKLEPDQQRMLDNMTRGHGKQYVERTYARLSKSGGK